MNNQTLWEELQNKLFLNFKGVHIKKVVNSRGSREVLLMMVSESLEL